jgi:hypothetical protein
MANKKRLTKSGFISWLKSFDGDWVIGYSGRASENPIAVYLSLLGYEDAEVDVAIGITWKRNNKTYKMKRTPPWVNSFTTSISGLTGRHALSAGRCLQIANDLKRRRSW